MEEKIFVGQNIQRKNGINYRITKVFKNKHIFLIEDIDGNSFAVSIDEVEAGYYVFEL